MKTILKVILHIMNTLLWSKILNINSMSFVSNLRPKILKLETKNIPFYVVLTCNTKNI